MKPYYEDGQVTIYHSRWQDVELALVLTDPPYGISHPEDQERGGLCKFCADAHALLRGTPQ